MAAMVIFGALAAFGGLCALWILVGATVPGDREGILIYRWRSSAAGRGFVARWRLQWDLGLLRGKLAVVDLGLTDEDRVFLARWGRNVEIWSPEEASGLGWEREDGTGIGDHPGCHRHCGISEL